MMMSKSLQSLRQNPILLLLALNMLIGLFTFRDYGLSWDEPLFYDYASSLGYAYSPREWFSGDFNLDKVYGASESDHANRGPAYILLAYPAVRLLEAFGVDSASAWHLINFLTFQLGVYLLYRLAKRSMNDSAALASAAFFAWQPLLWGHAFINPKDPPFLVFFLGAMCLGFEAVDEVAENGVHKTSKTVLAAFSLGIATSIRVLGPLAGFLVGLYGLSKATRPTAATWLKSLALYTAVALLVTFVTWPYLWTDPLQNFFRAFGFMSDNPTHLKVLFYGNLYHADALPHRYLPVLLGLTMTEVVWLLFPAGALVGFWRQISRARGMPAGDRSFHVEYWILFLWFLIPLGYVLLLRPPMYDGFRHFLFMLPPVFIIAGLVFEKMFAGIRTRWINLVLLAAIFAPAVLGISQLHPYQYTYYNSFVGGTGGAFREFETDYWLTCYKEAIQEFQSSGIEHATLYVNREGYIAQAYADERLTVLERRGSWGKILPGDYILVNTRANDDRQAFHDAPIVLEVGRAGAVFCVIKRIE